MKAFVLDRYGKSDGIRLGEIPELGFTLNYTQPLPVNLSTLL